MTDVYLFIYDVSKGFASGWSTLIIGKQIEGIWHTGIVIFNKEIYYGSSGIESCRPEGTLLGPPDSKVYLGQTSKSETELNNYLLLLSMDSFLGSKYELLYHNCNTFSNELSQWLVGSRIPEHIINLPLEVLTTPIGQMMQSYIEKFSPAVSLAYSTVAAYYSEPYIKPNFFEEPLHSSGIPEDANALNQQALFCLRSLLQCVNKQTKVDVTDGILDLLRSLSDTSISTDTKLLILDVLRLAVLNCENLFQILITTFSEWVSSFMSPSDVNITEMKLKFMSNFVGVLEKYSSNDNSEVLNAICRSLLDMESLEYVIDTWASVSRNIACYHKSLDENLLLDFSCRLCYLILKKQDSVLNITKENLLAALYLLVKNYPMIKDVANAQDINIVMKEASGLGRYLYNKMVGLS